MPAAPANSSSRVRMARSAYRDLLRDDRTNEHAEAVSARPQAIRSHLLDDRVENSIVVPEMVLIKRGHETRIALAPTILQAPWCVASPK